MQTTRKFTRAERMALIDLRVPGDHWQRGIVEMLFVRLTAQPAMLDFDDCMRVRTMFDVWDDDDHDFDPNDLV